MEDDTLALTTDNLRLTLAQLHLPNREYSFRGEQSLESMPGHRRVEFDQGHRLSAPLPSPEMKSADVNAALTQNGADAADHSGHVAIVHHQHMTLRNCFDAKTVDIGDAAMAGIRITKDGS